MCSSDLFPSHDREGYLGIIVYILIGILITVVIQSSAATLAIVITALNADSITYVNAIALKSTMWHRVVVCLPKQMYKI